MADWSIVTPPYMYWSNLYEADAGAGAAQEGASLLEAAPFAECQGMMSTPLPGNILKRDS